MKKLILAVFLITLVGCGDPSWPTYKIEIAQSTKLGTVNMTDEKTKLSQANVIILDETGSTLVVKAENTKFTTKVLVTKIWDASGNLIFKRTID